jgi:phosphoribosyl-AMP cyclohydrolase
MKFKSITEINEIWANIKLNDSGLIPAIVIEHQTNQVLMQAWMNKEAFEKTLTTGNATYFSRSRNKLWVKGEESGNTQSVIEMRLDCDKDTILLKVEQNGNACHTGAHTCFDETLIWSIND